MSADKTKYVLILGFLAGVCSRLFIHTPVGFIAIFDLVCYAVGPILFLRMLGKTGNREHCFLGVIMLWVVGSVFANVISGYPNWVTYKAAGITFSMWCMSVVCFALLRKTPKSFIYFIMGVYIGAIISLYAFHNGALLEYASSRGYSDGYIGEFLIDKQTLPLWGSLVTISGGIALQLIWKRAPSWIVAAGFITFGIYVLLKSGSRFVFGINVMVGALTFVMGAQNVQAKNARRKLPVFIVLGGLLTILIIGLYSTLVERGSLGEKELAKYEDQFDEERGLTANLLERGSYAQTWEDFKAKPLGSGGVGAIRHSAISDSLYKEGIFVIPFWFYYMWNVFGFMRKQLLEFGRWAPFLMHGAIVVIVSAIASPFGGRGSYCLMGCLAVLSADPAFMQKWVLIRVIDESNKR